MLRVAQLSMERASSLPARRFSPAKNDSQIRPRLNQYYTFDHAVSLIKTSKNIIVLTGAGISTSLGVPDFRSSNGIYKLLVDSIYDDPQELFHIENFKTEPKEFFKQAAKVFPKMQNLEPADGAASNSAVKSPLVPRFSSTHAFLAMLQHQGKLLTNYTQNIDGLEIAAGVPASKLIQCHGTLSTATCMSCGRKTTARKYMPVVQAGGIPFCKCSLIKEPKPKDKNLRGRSGKKKRKRDEFEDSDSELEPSRSNFPKGLLKPDMTFFGEHISYSYAPRLETDKNTVDLLVIIGTSLQVAPVNDMLLAIPPAVPQIWISKDRCQRQGVKVDIELLGECDLIIEEIARRAGWTAALAGRMWSKQRTNEVTKPTQTQPSQSKPPPPKAAHGKETLQIRPRNTDTPSTKSSASAGIVIKVNDEEVCKSDTGGETELKHDHGENPTPKCPAPAPAPASANDVKGETKIPKLEQPTKVLIELEEGTSSRWYVRRAK